MKYSRAYYYFYRRRPFHGHVSLYYAPAQGALSDDAV